MSDDIRLSKEEIQELISCGVEDALTRMGIDSSNPLEMQRDFQHLRDWRLAVRDVRRRGMFAMASVLIAGVLGALWMGVKVLLN